jgi:hypothetical protein
MEVSFRKKCEMIWKHLDRPDLGFANVWSQNLQELESKHIEQFPDFRGAQTLVVTSDYSGYHKGAKFETISFLLASLDGCSNWESKRVFLRTQLLPNRRRMSFKGLNDKYRRNALASFLDAANDIPGILVSFCTSRNLPFPLCADEETDRSNDLLAPTDLFKELGFRRLIRCSSFVSLFLAGLSSPMQDLYWFSDEDDFTADSKRICAATDVIANVISHFLPHSLRNVRFGSTKSDDGSRSIEDLASLPDLAAGAISEVFSGTNHTSYILQEIPPRISIKSRYIMSWLANSSSTLKKLICVLTLGDQPRTLKTQWIRMHSESARVQPVSSTSSLYRGSIFRGTP